MDKDVFKIVLLGNSGVGKTSILHWLMYERNIGATCPTIGAAFASKTLEINGKKIKFNIWDTAGQERFRSIAKIYYKNTIGCIFVFDITDRLSFDALKNWISDYKQYNDMDKYSLLLVANKCDIDKTKWVVSEEEINNFSKLISTECIYTNCIDGTNIIKIFHRIGELILGLNIKTTNSEKDTLNNDTIKLHLTKWPVNISDCKCLK